MDLEFYAFGASSTRCDQLLRRIRAGKFYLGGFWNDVVPLLCFIIGQILKVNQPCRE